MDGSGTIGANGLSSATIALAVVIGVGFWVVFSIALAKIFQKLGDEGWKAWVPILNIVVIYQLGGVSALWVIAMFFPVINIVALVFFYVATHQINRQLGRGAGSTVLAIFLPLIWALVLGFGAERAGGTSSQFASNGHGAPTPWNPITPQHFESPDSAHQRPANHGLPAALSHSSVTPSSRPPIDHVPGTRAAIPGTFAAPAPVTPAASVSPPDQLAPPAQLAKQTTVTENPSTFEYPLDGDTIITGAQQPAVDHDETVIVNRQLRPQWTIETAQGQTVELTRDVVVLGRNPIADPNHPNAQLVAVRDTGKTVSKVHARIALDDGRWMITDLDSTNGVIIVDAGGIETELVPGSPFALGERFVLGELPTRIFRA
ncbi:DUF5684 domain-containing protein [Homoserinimonas sp. OAct 916]|uniref:DUF5684 domain-containing protein n=1 Tax=Homoserinimonas sp. OAct 916 TaxID=2211450 RepID=UPI00130061C0|nr:DUF5684 domain-containing protein [Homoserinimonas sp. OAct 916]